MSSGSDSQDRTRHYSARRLLSADKVIVPRSLGPYKTTPTRSSLTWSICSNPYILHDCFPTLPTSLPHSHLLAPAAVRTRQSAGSDHSHRTHTCARYQSTAPPSNRSKMVGIDTDELKDAPLYMRDLDVYNLLCLDPFRDYTREQVKERTRRLRRCLMSMRPTRTAAAGHCHLA